MPLIVKILSAFVSGVLMFLPFRIILSGFSADYEVCLSLLSIALMVVLVWFLLRETPPRVVRHVYFPTMILYAVIFTAVLAVICLILRPAGGDMNSLNAVRLFYSVPFAAVGSFYAVVAIMGVWRKGWKWSEILRPAVAAGWTVLGLAILVFKTVKSFA